MQVDGPMCQVQEEMERLGPREQEAPGRSRDVRAIGMQATTTTRNEEV